MNVRGLAFLVLIAGLPAASFAASGSRYLTLDHWAYEGIRLLHGAGYLEELDPLVQPYHRSDVAAEVRKLDPERLSPALAHWARLLRDEFREDLEPDLRWGVWLEAGAHASTSARSDPLRPLGDDGNAWPYGRAAGWVITGPAAAEVVVLGDRYLDEDPDGEDPQRRIARTESAYLNVALPFGEIVAGRFARNWSRLGGTGLLVGRSPTPYAQLGIELRAGRFTLRSFLGELDTLDVSKRYIAAHRIDFAWPHLGLSLGESIVTASERGGFTLRHLNPVEIFYFEADAPPEDLVQNLMLDASVWVRGGAFEAYGEGLLDDVDVDPEEGADREPTSYAFSLGGRWSHSAGHAVGADYLQVSAWTYRTPHTVDRYSYLGRGLGENYSDFDRVSLWADVLVPWYGIRLTPALDVLRQGEGSFRDPLPPSEEYLASPNLFLGTRETTVRFALRGRLQPERQIWLAWDAGSDKITNRQNVEGADETVFSAVVEAGVRWDP